MATKDMVGQQKLNIINYHLLDMYLGDFYQKVKQFIESDLWGEEEDFWFFCEMIDNDGKVKGLYDLKTLNWGGHVAFIGPTEYPFSLRSTEMKLMQEIADKHGLIVTFVSKGALLSQEWDEPGSTEIYVAITEK